MALVGPSDDPDIPAIVPERSGVWFNRIAPFASILGLLVVWEIAVIATGVPPWILPKPTEFLGALVENAPMLATQAWATIKATLIGFVVGSAIAIPLGLAIGLFISLERSLYYAVVLVNTLPKVALAPLLVVYFGYGLTSKVILIAIGAFVPVLVDSIAGFKFIDKRLLFITRSAGATRLQTLTYLRFPEALPHIVSGLKTSLIIAIVIAIVVEYVASTNGLGYVATRAVMNDNIPLVFAVVTVGAAIGFAATFIMEMVEKLLLPWKRA